MEKPTAYCNEQGEIIGSAPRQETLEKKLRRAISRVFLFNAEGKVFLQKRSSQASLAPSTWDNSASGHVDGGEDFETAAYRELAEELGVTNIELKKVTSGPFEEPWTDDSLVPSFDHIFTVITDKEILIDGDEVVDGKWFTINEVLELIKNNPEQCAPALQFWFSKIFSE